MNNVIDITINAERSKGIMLIHNDRILSELLPGHNHVMIDVCNQTNDLSIQNTTQHSAIIDHLTMFDIGKDKLVYFGKVQEEDRSYQSQEIPPGCVWTLQYNYPVFAWLHQVCDMGWCFRS